MEVGATVVLAIMLATVACQRPRPEPASLAALGDSLTARYRRRGPARAANLTESRRRDATLRRGERKAVTDGGVISSGAS